MEEPTAFNQLVANVENYGKCSNILNLIKDKKFSVALKQACNEGDIYLVKEILSYLETQADTIPVKIYIEEKSPSNGKTALHWTTNLLNSKGNEVLQKKPKVLPILRLLLKYNPDITIQDHEQHTFYDYLNKEDKEKLFYITSNIHLNATNTSNCLMNKAILTNATEKPIVVTLGVATCIAVIIHDSATKLTLFAHLGPDGDNEKIQAEFLSIFREKGINSTNLHVYLAGGIKSHFASQQAAGTIQQFWIAQNVTLNTDLLFSRDFIAIKDPEEFGNGVLAATKMLCERNQLFLSRLSACSIATVDDALKDFIINVMNTRDGMIYSRPTNNHQYHSDAKKNQLYLFIETTIGLSIKECLKVKEICPQNYLETHTLLMAHNICNPLSTDEKRIVISFHDPHQCVLHLVGFNLNQNKLFICTEDCTKLSEETYHATDYSKKYNTPTTIPIHDLTKEVTLEPSNGPENFDGIFHNLPPNAEAEDGQLTCSTVSNNTGDNQPHTPF